MELVFWWHHKKSEVEKSTSDFCFTPQLCIIPPSWRYGLIPFVALPGKMLYRESDLRAALEKNYVAPFAHRNAEDFPAVYGRR